jgi:hypothetical protein
MPTDESMEVAPDLPDPVHIGYVFHLKLLAAERERCKSDIAQLQAEIERLKELLAQSHQQGFSDGCLAQLERCAQVAETCDYSIPAGGIRNAIAAAIRALKDEP